VRLQPLLETKVVIDTMNAWRRSDYIDAGFTAEMTEAAWIARLLPRSRVVRAFSHIDFGSPLTECTRRAV
jgi:predicted dinucleotide-binding enzyme